MIEPKFKETGTNNIEKIFDFAKKYSWSTNPDYLGIRESIIIDKGVFKDFFPTSQKYEEFIKNILVSKKHNTANSLLLE